MVKLLRLFVMLQQQTSYCKEQTLFFLKKKIRHHCSQYAQQYLYHAARRRLSLATKPIMVVGRPAVPFPLTTDYIYVRAVTRPLNRQV